jgi:hypothetical protein
MLRANAAPTMWVEARFQQESPDLLTHQHGGFQLPAIISA